MPLEFRCKSCSRLLRTPDESAGKKAKCPQCGAIVDVPLESSAAAETAVFEPTSRPPDDSTNPYAAPTTISSPDPVAVPKGELHHTRISFDDLLKRTWDFFRENLSDLVVFGAVLFGIQVALMIVGQTISFAAQLTGEPVVIGGIALGFNLVSFAVSMAVKVGTAVYCVKMARGKNAKINDFFACGPFLLRAVGIGILLGLILIASALIFVLPVSATIPLEEPAIMVPVMIVSGLIWLVVFSVVMLRYTVAYQFLVDRDLGVIESLSMSAKYMNGNKLAAFLALLIVLFLGTIFYCCTLTVGSILYFPFYGMLEAILYFSITGQPYQQPDSSTA